MPTESTTLTRFRIKKILKSKYGACAQLARDLNVKPHTVSLWLKGTFDSARISEAAIARAIEISKDSPHV